MSNMLTNPTLKGFSLGRYFTEQGGQVGTIENPDNWKFITIARESDPEKLPQSLHRDRGFVIAAGYRAWEAAYTQGGIQLQANQRYLAKANFKPDINFPNQNVDLTAVTWRFRITVGDKVLEQDWDMTQKPQFKQDEVFQFVFEAKEDLTIEYQFWARSVYAGNAADFNVYQLSLEAIAADYGASIVPSIGTGTSTQVSTPTTETETSDVTIASGTSDKSSDDAPTAAEIDEIVASLRSLAQENADAVSKLNALADRLESLK